MPFDGTEFVATSVQTATTPPRFWALLRQACRRISPAGRALAFDIPAAVPVESPVIATVQVLRLARTLIEDERHWIQRRYETLDGRRCAVGALRSASRLLSLRSLNNEAHNLLLEVAVGRGFSDIEKMNDHSNHTQVMSAFDVAIARAQARL
ncbi:MAG TPA: hypothetical protein VMB34_01620 [Acetobacteraceae bacterium]|nr:hypothetical protein [Acetobacteraceae bacterium]